MTTLMVRHHRKRHHLRGKGDDTIKLGAAVYQGFQQFSGDKGDDKITLDATAAKTKLSTVVKDDDTITFNTS